MLCSFITDRADGDEETKADMGKEQVLEETRVGSKELETPGKASQRDDFVKSSGGS